ncbi:sensory box/GGDEF family protein [Bacillus sp. OxB-1]|uniref:putative bifunctional diguanylate cyclase/phosphodiesterase n=1 Tax=Bacillus sp. (strain OxB-1) TaxID=98228 RepID=UPI000581F035|nr:EAL domain-containing protein [Bacillus sp. OxB-1]BAQ10344.1 sensory box/GGDEF family protein [Bacillus sp. OxB-1]
MGYLDATQPFDQILSSSLSDSPFHMVTLIGKNDRDEFDVLYSNQLAQRHFQQSAGIPASDFFGGLWKPIKSTLRKLLSQGYKQTEIEWKSEGITTLYELYLQTGQLECGKAVIVLEINERQDLAAERENRTELEHKYMSFIDRNLDPIFTIGRDYATMYSNEAVYEVYGYRQKEVSGRSILNLLDDEKASEFKYVIARALGGETVEMDDVSFRHKNGHLLPTYLKAIPILMDGYVNEIHLLLRDTSLHQENNEKLHFLSNHDQLTGLWNRNAMKSHFAEDAAYAQRAEESLAFLHLGLDRFKLINESLGHTGADEILKIVADRLKKICPATAKLYRKSGDEFIMTLSNHTTAKTEKLSQQILGDFAKPFYYNHQEYFISASLGIAIYPEDGKTLEDLLRKSEQALRFVKQRGRSHYRFYQDRMNSTFPDEALMESHLRRAIELDELSVHYQPQVDLRTGQISSFEALLRWNNRKFGFVSPGQFIPILEESGLIHEIGDWVLDQVCRQLKEWQKKKFRFVRIAVNISPQQFRLETFIDKVKKKIIDYDIAPSSLEVEITESSLTDMDETISTLNELKKIGVTIAVDDFGTGYSSLSYLKQYPIDIIKIDRSFIKDIETDAKNAAIARTIINLAHNLGMDVIAEGVEKELQAQILLEANCFKAQGFLYSKAVPAEVIVEKYFSAIL